MDEWRRYISSLVDQLQSTDRPAEGMEAQALTHLKDVLWAADPKNQSSLAFQIAQLRDFWLNSVPWCSELSRVLERILMDYEQINH